MKKFILIFLLLFTLVLNVAAQDTAGDSRYVGTNAAPDFPPGLDWINVDAPLTLDDLQGKIVLLDFWTYGCINCIHMIPVLADLEARFADELIVIGVHSAKFANESETTNIRQIVQRYNLHHPVINDSDFVVWRTYGIRAWPTFVVIDPNGNVVAAQSGEVPYEAFADYFSAMIDYYDANPQVGAFNREPLSIALEGAGDPGTPLLYPGKVLADPEGNRLFIADSNHHRIVIADLTTHEVLDIIGTGRRGFAEGDYDQAQFDQPQGMEIDGDTLYIADVNNHAIRLVDLAEERVMTIAGTGIRGSGIFPFDTVFTNPTIVELRSPWDVKLGADNILYIAMAGSHQLWQMNLAENTIQAAVGNGREAQLSATLSTSELAQPSGLHYHDGLLYFADSESSTVRVADIAEDSVAVIAGTTENSLFEFGDAEGPVGESLLQHALGVTANDDGSIVYIADTYNSKIRWHDVATGETSTLFGLTGNGGFRDGDAATAQFDEPGGLDYVDGKLYVADTNNHAIRIIDLEAGIVETLQFSNPEALAMNPDEPTIIGGNSAQGSQIVFDEQSVAPGSGVVTLDFTLPGTYYINKLVDSFVNLSTDGDAISFDAETLIITEESMSIPVTFTEGDGTLSLAVTLFYCEEDSYCLIEDVTFALPVRVAESAETSAITIEHEVVLPEGFQE